MTKDIIKVAAGSVPVVPADVEYNKEQILARLREAHAAGVEVLVLPELCLTGATCGDLFLMSTLLDAARAAAEEIVRATAGMRPVLVFGMPFFCEGNIYDCAVVAADGHARGLVPKTWWPARDILAQYRQFTPAGRKAQTVAFVGERVPMGRDLTFPCGREDTTFGVAFGHEILAGADVTIPQGASLIVCPSALGEQIDTAARRRKHLCAFSAQHGCACVMAGAHMGESTQDAVFASHHLIVQNGCVVAEQAPFADGALLFGEIAGANEADGQQAKMPATQEAVRRHPFLSEEEAERRAQLEMALQIQSRGLAARMSRAYAKRAVLGISGGLDSTLTLLVAVRAVELLGRPRTDVLAITMPCFGTTSRTKSNAVRLCELLGVPCRTIDIAAAVKQHFADIGQDDATYDVTYENAQARERTQILMDVANQVGGMVIGTGDMSELALGWATYNGDHMSMYGVNAGVPKTMVRELTRYEAARLGGQVSTILADILDTPVSPELLPADAAGNIAQRTEDLVGPYDLHDFFLYYMLGKNMTPIEIYRACCAAFDGEYDRKTVLHWLRNFYRRFFAQQFKRSCLPDGPQVTGISLSPRGGLAMPSDATSRVWLAEIEKLEKEC